MNSVIVGSLLFLIVFYYIIKNDSNKNLLEPAFLFNTIIMSTYFLSTLKLSAIQKEFPIIFTFEILSFCFVFYTGTKVNVSNIRQEKKDYFKLSFKFVCFILWCAVVLAFAMTIKKLGPPPTISKSNRAGYFLSGWGTIVLLYQLLFAISIYDGYNHNYLGKFRFLYIITSLAIAVLMSNKFQIITLIIQYIIARNHFYKKINFVHIVIFVIVIVAIFSILYQFVYKDMYGVSMDNIFIGYKMLIPRKYSFITLPYLYVVYNYENLYYYSMNKIGYTWGALTLGGIIDTLGINFLVSEETQYYINSWKSLLQIKSLTTGTMFKEFEMDGGYIFTLIGTYICGIWSSHSYKKFKSENSFLNFYIYSITTSAIMLSFFTNSFVSKITIINVIAAIVVDKFISKKFILGRIVR